ncbi:MAG: acyltransferase family protein [Muribaculaceae bacterium]|nr:acyltransferase family protein [Muribaculaceae bacterium]
MKPGKRLHYFDMLKGLAIFLVVMGHVLTMCIRDIDRALLFKIIGQVHMPIFFFISGYFTYKLTADGKTVMPRLGQRFMQLVIPGIIVGLIFMVYFPHSGLQSPFDMSFNGMWCTEYKNGYWFTITLFLIILLYSGFARVLDAVGSVGGRIGATAALWIVLIVLDGCFESEMWWKLLSLKLVVTFFPAFMAGVFAKASGEAFMEMIKARGVYTGSLIIAGLCFYILAYRWEFPSFHSLIFLVAEPVMHVALAIVGLRLVEPWSREAFADTASPLARRFASMWQYIGSKSLSIYLLHYFFLFPLPVLQDPLRGMALDIVPTLTVSVIVASLVVAVTLLVNAIISRSPLLARLLTGSN